MSLLSIREDEIPEIRIIGNVNCKEGKGESQFTQPRGICLNHETKELFVVDCNNHRVQVFHLYSQAFIRQIGKGTPGNSPGSLMYPVGICMDHENCIYVADTNNHRIVKFNHLTGTFIRAFGSQGNAPGCFNCPYGLCIDHANGELYVADYENNRIQVVSKENGTFIRFIGSGPGQEPAQFNQPIDVCLDDESHSLLVADYSNNRIQVLDQYTGQCKAILGGSSNDINVFSGPRSVYINKASGLLFAADRENHRIQVYNKNTYQFLRHIGLGIGTNGGQFNRPMELCVDNESGTLIVVDGYNHRVQILELPELLKEKLRLQLMKRHESDLVLNIPSSAKPSNLVVSLLHGSTSHFTPLCDGLHIISIPRCENIFQACVSSDSIHLFSTSTIACDTWIPIESVNSEGAKMSQLKSAIDIQGEVFSKMLDNLTAMNLAPESLDSMLSPTLAAMQSLVQKDWLPNQLSKISVKTLFVIMTSTYAENSCSSAPACLDILKGYACTSSQNQHIIWDLIQEKLFRLSKKSNTAILGIMTNSLQSLAYIFDILNHLIVLKSRRKLASRKSCSSCLFHNSKKSSYQRFCRDDFRIFPLQLLFGTTVAQSLQRDENFENYDPKLVAGKMASSISSFVCLFESFCRVVGGLLELESLRHGSVKKSIDEYRKHRVIFLDGALRHLQELDKGQLLKSKPKEKRLRGGRNIWDPTCPFAIGDLVDCMDKEKIWFESIIVDLLPDGSVKVHFMGWGSKWDDVINKVELDVRIAPLNSKTTNWRAELFEGGLIEIKCNDDLVNQKWMWGRIRKLNLDESWVEVIYSFSNEPLVVKRAWLYGETICPVGMHTKDKSKNAAATVVKPGKRVDQIIQEQATRKANGKEIIFFDYDDDFIESLPSPHPFSTSWETSTSFLCEFSPIIQISNYFFDSLMREIVFLIGDISGCAGDSLVCPGKDFVTFTNDILLIIFRSVGPKQFLERVIKPIYFQAAVQAKAIIDPNFFSSDQSMANWTDIMKLSLRLSTLFSRYAENVSACCGNFLSFPTIKFIQERIRSTINRCGFTPLANKVINCFVGNRSLLHELIGPLVHSESFSGTLQEVRKFFHTIVLSAGNVEMNSMITLIENEFVKFDVEKIFTFSANQVEIEDAISCCLEKARLLQRLKAKYGNKYLLDHPLMVVVVQRVALLYSKNLTSNAAIALGRQLAQAFDWILSKPVNEFDQSRCIRIIDSPICILQALLELFQVFHNEEFTVHFQKYYLELFAFRLLSGCSSSLASEEMVLQGLSLLDKGRPLLVDVRRSILMDDSFFQFNLESSDFLHEYDHEDDVEVLNIIMSNGFTVLNCTPFVWSSVKNLHCTTGLQLPSIMISLQDKYENFLMSRPTSASKRLQWCNGYGRVTLQTFVGDVKKRVLHCDELQCVLLLALAEIRNQESSVGFLSSVINISTNVLQSVVSMLIKDEILVIKEKSGACIISTVNDATVVCLNTDFLSECKVPYIMTHARVDYADLERAVQQWNFSRVDAAIVRYLKNNQSSGCDFLSICTYVRSQKCGWNGLSDKDIYDRCDHLYVNGIISRDDDHPVTVTHSKILFFKYFPCNSRPNTSLEVARDLIGKNFVSLTDTVVDDPPSMLVESFSDESKRDMATSSDFSEEGKDSKCCFSFLNWIFSKQPLVVAPNSLRCHNSVSQLITAAPQLLLSIIAQLDAGVCCTLRSLDSKAKFPPINSVLTSIKYHNWDYRAIQKKFLFHVFIALPARVRDEVVVEYVSAVQCPESMNSSEDILMKFWNFSYPTRSIDRFAQLETQQTLSLAEFFENMLVKATRTAKYDVSIRDQEQKAEHKESVIFDSVDHLLDRRAISSIIEAEATSVSEDDQPHMPATTADKIVHVVEQNSVTKELVWFKRESGFHRDLIDRQFHSSIRCDNILKLTTEISAVDLFDNLDEFLRGILTSCQNDKCLVSSETTILLLSTLVEISMNQLPQEVFQPLWWFDLRSSSLLEMVQSGLLHSTAFLKLQAQFYKGNARNRFWWDEIPGIELDAVLASMDDTDSDLQTSLEAGVWVSLLYENMRYLKDILQVHWTIIAKILKYCNWNVEYAVEFWMENNMNELDWTSSFKSVKELKKRLHCVPIQCLLNQSRTCTSCGLDVSIDELCGPKSCTHYACRKCWDQHVRVGSPSFQNRKFYCINSHCETLLEFDFIVEVSGIESGKGWLRKYLRDIVDQYSRWRLTSASVACSTHREYFHAVQCDSFGCSVCCRQFPSSEFPCEFGGDKNISLGRCYQDQDEYKNYTENFHLHSKSVIDSKKAILLQLQQRIKDCCEENTYTVLSTQLDYCEVSLECDYLLDHLRKRSEHNVIDSYGINMLHDILASCTNDVIIRPSSLGVSEIDIIRKGLADLRWCRDLLHRKLSGNDNTLREWITKQHWSYRVDQCNSSIPSFTHGTDVVFGTLSTSYLQILPPNKIIHDLPHQKVMHYFCIEPILDQLRTFEELPRDSLLELIWQLKESFQALSFTSSSLPSEILLTNAVSLSLNSSQFEVIVVILDYAISDTDTFSMLLECFYIYLHGRLDLIDMIFNLIENERETFRSSSFLESFRTTCASEKYILEIQVSSVLQLFCTALDIYNYQYRTMSMECVRTLRAFFDLLSLFRKKAKSIGDCGIDPDRTVVSTNDNCPFVPYSSTDRNLIIDTANYLVTILLKERSYYTEEAMEFFSSPFSIDDTWSGLDEQNLISGALMVIIDESNELVTTMSHHKAGQVDGHQIGNEYRFWFEFSLSLVSVSRLCCVNISKKSYPLSAGIIRYMVDSANVLCDVVHYLISYHHEILHSTLSTMLLPPWFGDEPLQKEDTLLRYFMVDGLSIMVRNTVQIVQDDKTVDRVLNMLATLLALPCPKHQASDSSANVSIHQTPSITRFAMLEFFEAISLLLSQPLLRSSHGQRLTIVRLTNIMKTLSQYFTFLGPIAIIVCLDCCSIETQLLKLQVDLISFFCSTKSAIEKSQFYWTQFHLDKILHELRSIKQTKPEGTSGSPNRCSVQLQAVDMVSGSPTSDSSQSIARPRSRSQRRGPTNQDNLRPMMRAFLDHLLLDRVLSDLNNSLQRGDDVPTVAEIPLTMAAMMLMQSQNQPIQEQPQQVREENFQEDSRSLSRSSVNQDTTEGGDDAEDILNLQLDFNFPDQFTNEDDV